MTGKNNEGLRMGKAQQHPVSDPDYLEYFGLERPPFARVAGPGSIFVAEQYALLIAHLANAKAEPDCLVVLRGVDGAGKTTLLNRYLSCLGEEETFASIDETCHSAEDFYRRFFEQIGFDNIDGKLEELQTITREFMIHRATLTDPILLVIDNAHKMHRSVFEQLRWLATIEHRGRRVLSVILAGNRDLACVLDSPAMADLTFHHRVDFHIRAFTQEETAEYIDYRLSLTGIEKEIRFTPEAIALIYRFSSGIPRMINRVCGLLLSEACARKTHDVDDVLVRDVAEAEQLPANVFPLKNRGRRRNDDAPVLLDADSGEYEQIALGEGPDVPAHRERIAATRQPDIDVERLFDQIATLSEQIGNLKAENAKVNQALDAKDGDIAKLRESMATKDASLERNVIDSKKLAESLKEQKRAARNAKSRATRAENRIAKLEEAKKKLQKASTGLRADLRAAKSKATKLTQTEKRLKKTEGEKKKLLESLKELEALRDAIAEKDSDISALKSELAELTASDTMTQARLAVLPAPVEDEREDAANADDADVHIVAFEVVRGGQVDQVVKLGEDDTRIMIGRSDDSELQLDSEFVSRHHALIFCKPGEAYIEDLNSFNGTIVNGNSVSRCELRPNDTIIVGEFRIRPLA